MLLPCLPLLGQDRKRLSMVGRMSVCTNTCRVVAAIAAAVFSLEFAIAAPSQGQKLETSEQVECKKATTQVEINACTRRNYDSADASMNRNYRQLRAALSERQKQALLEAQRAWLRFRNFQCVFERGNYAGGTLATAVYFECLGEITRQRSEQLRVQLDNLQR